MDNADMICAIREHAKNSYPNEACGLVVRRGNKSIVFSCKNASSDPRHHFLLDPSDYAAACDAGEVIGVWHTHVDIAPDASDADKAGCENCELPWYILSVFKRENGFEYSDLVSIEPSGFEMEYIGRPYAFGVFDCWTLVRDYYKREYGIHLRDYIRVNEFWKTEHSHLGDQKKWEAEGLVRIVDEDPIPGDLLFIQTDDSGEPSHAAIYIGDEMILHHCSGRISKRDVYGGYWKRHTLYHMRHKSKC